MSGIDRQQTDPDLGLVSFEAVRAFPAYSAKNPWKVPGTELKVPEKSLIRSGPTSACESHTGVAGNWIRTRDLIPLAKSLSVGVGHW